MEILRNLQVELLAMLYLKCWIVCTISIGVESLVFSNNMFCDSTVSCESAAVVTKTAYCNWSVCSGVIAFSSTCSITLCNCKSFGFCAKVNATNCSSTTKDTEVQSLSSYWSCIACTFSLSSISEITIPVTVCALQHSQSLTVDGYNWFTVLLVQSVYVWIRYYDLDHLWAGKVVVVLRVFCRDKQVWMRSYLSMY